MFIRGMAMGSADIVPGVSGGTVALITGIYEHNTFSPNVFVTIFVAVVVVN